MRIPPALLLVSILLSGCSKRSPEERAMTPQDSLKAMALSEDFHVELFAAEPDVMSPVEMAFDENGRVYVAEMLDYPDDPPPGKPARSRIRLLEDTNGDGKTWSAVVFAENVLAVSGFMPWKGGLIVTSAPDILYLKDTDGDGKADVRKVLYTGFPKVNQEARITNPRLGVDNWIYCSNTGSDGRITSPRPSRDGAGSGARHGFSLRSRSAARPNPPPDRRNSDRRSTTSVIASSRRTRRTSGMWWCR